MRDRTRRLRRLAGAGAVATMVTAVVAAMAGAPAVEVPTAGASANATANYDSIAAAARPVVASTGSGLSAGSLTLTLVGTAATTGTDTYLRLSVAPSGGTSVEFAGASISTGGVQVVSAASLSTPESSFTIEIGGIAPAATATVTVSGVTYDTTDAEGTIVVTPSWTLLASGAGRTEGGFTPRTAVDAVSSKATPVTKPTVTMSATGAAPPLRAGGTGQAAGAEVLTFTGESGHSTGWAAGELEVKLTGACTSEAGSVGFAGTPTVTVTSTASKDLSTTPEVTASVTTATCPAGTQDLLVLHFADAVTIGGSGVAKLVVSGIAYDVGATAPRGPVTMTTLSSGMWATDLGATNSASQFVDADVSYAYVSTTPVGAAEGAYDRSITTVAIVEAKGHTVPSGYVCLKLSTSATFDTSAPATAKVAGGTGTVSSTVSYADAGDQASFEVTAPSSASGPSTYEVSGLAVDAPSAADQTVMVTATDGASTATCTNGATVTTANPAPALANEGAVLHTSTSSTTISGATADATAGKLLESTFTAAKTDDCVGFHATSTDDRPVVVATTADFQDALSAQYLASDLDTGVLLTPTGSLSPVTQRVLETEGVTTVDVVGGPLAVSTTVVKELEALPAYTCGGGKELETASTVVHVSVTRIYGETAAGTAQAVDSAVPASHVLSAAFPTAYAGVNAAKGTGMYNTTAGLGDAPASTGAQRTAILASDQEFQDAMAASTTSYWRKGGDGFPIVLTTPSTLTTSAADALATVQITQVVLVGGPDAVTDTVVETLQGEGIAVLRIAGSTYSGTASELAEFEYGTATHKGLGWTTSTVAVARGDGFTDGLAGAVVAGNTTATPSTTTVPRPLLLTEDPTAVGATLTSFLVAYGKKGLDVVKALQVFGGADAVSLTIVAKMETDIA